MRYGGVRRGEDGSISGGRTLFLWRRTKKKRAFSLERRRKGGDPIMALRKGKGKREVQSKGCVRKRVSLQKGKKGWANSPSNEGRRRRGWRRSCKGRTEKAGREGWLQGKRTCSFVDQEKA